MASTTLEPERVRVSQKGQATIPKPLRDKFGIETPGEVFVYEDGERIVLEPVPELGQLHGIHADDAEPGEVLARVRAEKDAERQREQERTEKLRPDEE